MPEDSGIPVSVQAASPARHSRSSHCNKGGDLHLPGRGERPLSCRMRCHRAHCLHTISTFSQTLSLSLPISLNTMGPQACMAGQSHCLLCQETLHPGYVSPCLTTQQLCARVQVDRLMDLIVNSLYSNREVFLRELVSNASDALDKLRFIGLTDRAALGDDDAMEIRIKADKDAKTIVIE